MQHQAATPVPREVTQAKLDLRNQTSARYRASLPYTISDRLQEQAEQQHENQTAFHDAFLLIFLPVYHSFSLKSLNFS